MRDIRMFGDGRRATAGDGGRLGDMSWVAYSKAVEDGLMGLSEATRGARAVPAAIAFRPS